MLPTGKKHISYSELGTWYECSYRHQLQYVKKIDLEVPNTNLVFGTATHAVSEHFLNTGIVDLSIAQKLFDVEFEKYKHIEDFQKNSKEKFLEIISNIMVDFPIYLNENFPNWQLVKAEEPLYEDLQKFFEKHEGLSFKGYIDVILKIPGKKPNTWQYWILDLKTANRPWNFKKIKDDKTRMQLIFYKKFWSEKHNIPMKDIRCGFLTLLKSAKPGKYCHLIPVSVGDITSDRSLTVLNNCLASIKRGMVLKNRNSCTYCPYKDTEWCT